MMRKTILSFGYIPKSKGGKQLTGLATGIFQLEDAVNKINKEYKVVIAATDIHQNKITVDNTEIWGPPINQPEQCSYEKTWPILLKDKGYIVHQVSIGRATSNELLR